MRQVVAPASGSPYPARRTFASARPIRLRRIGARLRLTRICLRCAWRVSRRRRRPGVGAGLRSPSKARLPHANVRAGGPGQHQRAEARQANSGTMPGVRVKMAPLVKYAGSTAGVTPRLSPFPVEKARGCPCPRAGCGSERSHGWRKRSGHAESRGREGRGERQARGAGQSRAGARSTQRTSGDGIWGARSRRAATYRDLPSHAHDRLERFAPLEVDDVAHGLGGDRFEGVACEERLVGRDDHVREGEQA